jgi:hypothetical protein
MTTGRINQVAAVVAGPPDRRSGTRRAAVASVWYIAASFRVLEQNASSHGFRTCPYPAARRRQDPAVGE